MNGALETDLSLSFSDVEETLTEREGGGRK